ncbi:glucosaminidase domain-containing protein [Listeria aquatica]
MFSIAKKHLLRIGLVSLSFSMIALPMQAKADDSSARITSAQQAFINEIAPHAKRVQKEHGILASITISQAILESNWGKSQLAQKEKTYLALKEPSAGDPFICQLKSIMAWSMLEQKLLLNRIRLGTIH